MLPQFIIHSPPTELDGPIIVAHSKFLEPMMILKIKINEGHIIIQRMLNFSWKISVGHVNCYSKDLMGCLVSFVQHLSNN